MGDAIAELKRAARLAADEPRYTYVYAVAVHGTGRKDEGIKLLAEAHQRFTGDTEILQALATMERDRGHDDAALSYARKLSELMPDDPQARNLLLELER